MSKWDDFVSEVERETFNRGPECTVKVFADGLDSDARTAVVNAMSNRKLTSSGIYRALRARVGDIAPSAHTINRHRRGDCKCGSDRGPA
ncbi:hypothetical protein [Streptomyces sp. NPDC101150]|uniref:hypothetical protein n=1 Tax=Streptomyces sp. NPDC101150 TaxID=3366114 RepID=UPI00382C1AC9